MQLGDFFRDAPYARPLCPKVVHFTGIANGPILPGGHPNPSGKPVAARITAALVFLSGDAVERARVDARESLRARFIDVKTKQPLRLDPEDVDVELIYQLLYRTLHEWDEMEEKLGPRMFESADAVRDHVVIQEGNRLMAIYNAYVEEEHPTAVDEATFRGAKESGARELARAAG
jgi:hypothetical protein